ncbi:MAG: ABC transporter permease, partial [Promethearchaeota archaeon]
ELRFSRIESSIIITELSWMQSFMGQESKINNLYMTLAQPELVYDTRNMYETTKRLETIAIQVQEMVGFDYQVGMPRLTQLDANAMQSDAMNMTFYFITFFSVMITGILINSILTTSVEERIREFGVIRVCGARGKFTFQLVLISGFLMGFVGTITGTLAGIALGPPFLNWFFSANFAEIWGNFGSLEFIILPQTITRSLVIGILSTTLISIFPALKASSINLSNAIDPARNASKGEEYRLKKEGSMDLKLMGIGLGIAATGIFIFLILPRILTGTGGPNLMNYILTALLLMVLVGLVLITIGIVPVLESLIGLILKPFIKKFYPVYRLNLLRYRRRNVGNILMFAMTFSFIFFISSRLEMQSANMAVSLQFQYGGDLTISNTGYPDQGNAVTKELMDELENIPGISKVAPIVHNTFDMVKLTSMMFSIGEEGFDAFDFDVLFGSIPKLEAQIGDLGDYEQYYCSLSAIDENYYDLVDHSLVMWDEATGSSAVSIDTLLSTTNSCIIAKSFADAFGITELPATVKITMRDPQNGGFRNISTFTVVGVSRGFPGMWNFRTSQANLFTGGGVMLNMEDYARLLNWGDPESPDFVIDKILMEITDDSLENMQEIQDYIKNYYGNEYSFIVDESVSKIQMMEESNQALNLIMQIILLFSILVSIFGLLSSMYSTILERMFELGILRAMGLKPAELRNMLMAEAVTILLSSGSMGAVVGWFIAWMLETNMSVITEIPAVTAVNISTLASTFLFSVGVSIVGMFFITRKVEKMQVIDVLRSSF